MMSSRRALQHPRLPVTPPANHELALSSLHRRRRLATLLLLLINTLHSTVYVTRDLIANIIELVLQLLVATRNFDS